MKLFGNTGNGQRARQSVPVKESQPEKPAFAPVAEPELDRKRIEEELQENLTQTEPKPAPFAPVEITIPDLEEPTPDVVLPEIEDEPVQQKPIEPPAAEEAPTPKKEEKIIKAKPEPKPIVKKEKPQEEEPKSNRGIIKGIILLAFSIAVLLITVFSVFSYLLKPDAPAKQNTQESTPKQEISTEPVSTTAPDIDERINAVAPESETEGIYNLLIVGIDDDDQYTDTVMMLHVDADSHQLSALSLPHNTLVYGDYDVPMIDEVYHNSGKGEEGIDALKEKVESMFGFPMDAHIVLTSDKFEELMNSFGTISFDVPETLESGLEKGTQDLDAAAAKELIQTKKYTDETIRRERVQLDFLQAIGTQKLSSLTQTELEILAKTFSELVDSNLTLENFAYLLLEFQNCDFANMKSYLMPGRIIKYFSRDYHQLDENAMLAILNMSFNPYSEDIDEDDVDIRTEKETDVPESDYIREKQNNDDDDDDDDNGGSYTGGGNSYGGDTDDDDNNPGEQEPTPEPDPEPDDNNPDEP